MGVGAEGMCEGVLLVLEPHSVSDTHTHTHVQAYTPTPTSPVQPMERVLGPDFSSLMETLILAIWKRVSRADSPGDPLAGLARC